MTLACAGAFALAAVIAMLVPHDTGWWLPLHLFLVGTVLLAISGTTQMFAVSWAAGPPPSAPVAGTQRWSLVLGAVLLAAGREAGLTALLGVGGTLVILALVVLASSLVATVTRGVQRRFDPSLRAYLAALVTGLGGCALGVVMGVDAGGDAYSRILGAHLTLNLFGLVGLVIVGTVPLFTATQIRAKASPRATPAAQSALLVVLLLALALAVSGLLASVPPLAAAGFGLYAAGLLALLALVPPVRTKQLRWAGPRVLQLGAGVVWWCAATVVAAVHAGADTTVFTPAVIGVLVVGGYAQIVASALAYLVPVLRGGGHERLTAGFGTTRAWPGLVLANVAAVAFAFSAVTVAVAAIVLWALDALARAALLARPAPAANG